MVPILPVPHVTAQIHSSSIGITLLLTILVCDSTATPTAGSATDLAADLHVFLEAVDCFPGDDGAGGTHHFTAL